MFVAQNSKNISKHTVVGVDILYVFRLRPLSLSGAICETFISSSCIHGDLSLASQLQYTMARIEQTVVPVKIYILKNGLNGLATKTPFSHRAYLVC